MDTKFREGDFKSTDGRSAVKYRIWEPEGKPLAALQIIHGMSEYIGRYDAFARYMASRGVLVAGDDHIGHGLSALPEDYGYMGESDGWRHMVDDEEKLRNLVSGQYPGLPYVILGHSMGSFILRCWLAMYAKAADVCGAIIMGSSGPNPATGAGRVLVGALRKFKGGRARSKLVNGMVFNSYAKPFASEGNLNAWLSRDRKVYEEYTADPMAGFSFTLAGYTDLFTLLGYVNGSSWYDKVPKDIPLLIASGAMDPVGGFGKGVAKVCEGLQKAGCEDVSMLLYEDMRHEILNEIGKEMVWEDMRDFVLDCAEKRKEL